MVFKKKKILMTRKNIYIMIIIDFDMTMSRYWTRDKVTGSLERNPSCHGIPSLYSKMDPKVSE